MHPSNAPMSGPDGGDADAVLARVMAEQADPEPMRASRDAVLAKAPDGPDTAGAQAPATHHQPDSLTSMHGGPDGKQIEDGVRGHLDYLSQLARQLGVPDPVEEYFAPVVGRWSDLHAEAERWRAAAKTADTATESLTKPLGSLDSAWRGKDAEAFVQYMGKMGLAGNDLSDAMNGMGQALDKTANGVREIVQQLAGVLTDTAESTSQAMTVPAKGDQRVRAHLDEMRGPTKDMFDAVRQVLEAFVKLCDGVDGGKGFDKITMKHTFPAENFAFPTDHVAAPKAKDAGTHKSDADGAPGNPAPHGGGGGGSAGFSGGGGGGSVGGGGGGAGAGGGGTPSAEEPKQPAGYVSAGESSEASQRPAAASAGAPAAGGSAHGSQGGMGGGMPMMGMGGMGGQGGGGDQEHKGKSRVVGDPADIFGQPTKTSPPVIGDEE